MIRIDPDVDVYRCKDRPDLEYRIISVHEALNGQYVWHTSGREGDWPITASAEAFLQYAEPAFTFFEEDRQYRAAYGGIVKVLSVFEFEDRQYATCIRTNLSCEARPFILGEGAYENYTLIK